MINIKKLNIQEKIKLFTELYKDIAGKGIGGDTELAHINKFESTLLKSVGGQGSINPTTGLKQYLGGGGGGGVELSIERDVFTATANQTAFTITSSITSSSNTQVYIDGVYQAKSNYTTSGSTVTFNTGVPLGAEVEVRLQHLRAG